MLHRVLPLLLLLLDAASATAPGCVCPDLGVSRFDLVDATTDQTVLTLKDGMRLDTHSLNLFVDGSVNIRAVAWPNDTVVEAAGGLSVRTTRLGTNATEAEHTEFSAPFAVLYDTDGNYHHWAPAEDAYRFEATLAEPDSGIESQFYSITVSFCGDCYARVGSWTVVDPNTGKDVLTMRNPPDPFEVDLASKDFTTASISVKAIISSDGGVAPGSTVRVTRNANESDATMPYTTQNITVVQDWTPLFDEVYEFCVTVLHTTFALPGTTDCVRVRFCSGCTMGPEAFVAVAPKRYLPGTELFTIYDGMEVNWPLFSDEPGHPFNLRCVMAPNDTYWDAVDLLVNGRPRRREHVAPYALGGDSPPGYYAANYKPVLGPNAKAVLRVGCQGIRESVNDTEVSPYREVAFTLCSGPSCSEAAITPNAAAGTADLPATEPLPPTPDNDTKGAAGRTGGPESESKWWTKEVAVAGGAGALTACVAMAIVMRLRKRRRPVEPPHSSPELSPRRPSRRERRASKAAIPPLDVLVQMGDVEDNA